MTELDLAPAPGIGLIRNATTGLVSDLDSSYSSVLYLVGNEVQVVAQDANAFLVGRTAARPAFAVNTNTANSVTGLQVTAAASGGGVTLLAISSGANETLTIGALGTGTINLQTNGVIGFQVGSVASAVDYLEAIPVATGDPATVVLQANGTDTNVHVSIVTRGTGALLFPNGTAANPGVRWAGALDAGLYRDAAAHLGVSLNGVASFTFTPQGFKFLQTGLMSLLDTNANTLLTFTQTASSVDFITIQNPATANPAIITSTASGSDTNIWLSYSGKGNGGVLTPGGLLVGTSTTTIMVGLETVHTSTGNNFSVGDHNTLSTGVVLQAINDTNAANLPIEYRASTHLFSVGRIQLSAVAYTVNDANGNILVNFAAAASAVDYLQFGNAAAGNPATLNITAAGSDTNISVNVALLGTGTFKVNSIVSQAQTARLTADTAPVNNSVVLVNVGLGLTIGANEVWLVTYYLAVSNGSAVPGLRFGLTGPAGFAFIAWGVTFAGTGATSTVASSASAAANPFFNDANAVAAEVSAILTARVTATAAGTVNLQFAQSVATVTNTIIQNGSYYQATRVA